MIDIVTANDGQDLGIYDTQTMRAGNILSVQLGSLEYAQDFGIDLEYFLSEDVSFQNESFKSYLIEVLSNAGINVVSVDEVIQTFYTNLNINIGAEETSTALVR